LLFTRLLPMISIGEVKGVLGFGRPQKTRPPEPERSEEVAA
jgi:hypothetical protein